MRPPFGLAGSIPVAASLVWVKTSPTASALVVGITARPVNKKIEIRSFEINFRNFLLIFTWVATLLFSSHWCGTGRIEYRNYTSI